MEGVEPPTPPFYNEIKTPSAYRVKCSEQNDKVLFKVCRFRNSYLFGLLPLLPAESTMFGIRQIRKDQSNTPLVGAGDCTR